MVSHHGIGLFALENRPSLCLASPLVVESSTQNGQTSEGLWVKLRERRPRWRHFRCVSLVDEQHDFWADVLEQDRHSTHDDSCQHSRRDPPGR